MTAAEYERWAAREQRAADGYLSAEAQAAGPHASQQDYPAAFENRRRAYDHLELAAENRAIARELKALDEQACAGIAADEPDPLARREQITFVGVLQLRSPRAPDAAWTVGVRVVLRPAPGMTAASLQHSVDCQIARERILSRYGRGTDDTPLAFDGVHASVNSTSQGFAVQLTAEDPDAVRDIMRWSEGLAQ